MGSAVKAQNTGYCQLLSRLLRWIVVSAFIAGLLTPASAQQSRLPIVRDAEIERLLSDYAEPLLKVAGVKRSRIDIVLVNSTDFNAFVSGRRIFVNTGTIVAAETPNEVIGVLAHEIAHLAGGHQDRLRQQIDRAQTIAAVTAVLGATAAVAAGASGNGSVAGAGGGLTPSALRRAGVAAREGIGRTRDSRRTNARRR